MKRIVSLGVALATSVALVAVRGASPAGALVSGQTVRASVSSSGGDGNDQSQWGAVSANGRYVAFQSDASNIVPGDNDQATDVFVRDLQTNTTVRASVSTNGGDPNAGSAWPSISANGRYVTFASAASDVVPNDTNNVQDIFVRDLVKGTTKRISVGVGGTEANDSSVYPVISDDGRWIAFQSDASNLVAIDSNNATDVFVADRVTGAITLVSHAGDVAANGYSITPDISAHGEVVAFVSAATNLAPNDVNGQNDVFAWTRATGDVQLVSVAFGGVPANERSFQPSVDAAGDLVAFGSVASNVLPNDSNGVADVFVRDLVAGTTQRVSVSATGGDPDNYSGNPSISGDGRSVEFDSDASNLVPGPASPHLEAYLRDLGLGVTQRLSVSANGGLEDDQTDVFQPDMLSSDGTTAVFDSHATNLVAGDGNAVIDVFARRPSAYLSIGDVLVAEPKSGTASATFAVTLSSPQPGPVTVDYATANGTATAPADYKPTSGTLTIPAGATSGQVKVTVKGDPTIDGDRTLFVALWNATGAVIADAVGQATIRDDFPVATPWLAVGDATVWEGDAKTTPATFTFTLSNPAPTDTSFQYVTADASAVAPGDYTAKSGTVTIAAGKRSATATINVKGDTLLEGDETFTLQIVASSVPSGISLARDTGTATVRNDD